VPLHFETDPVDDSSVGRVPLHFETDPVDDSADGPVPLLFETDPVDDSSVGRVPLHFGTDPVDNSSFRLVCQVRRWGPKSRRFSAVPLRFETLGSDSSSPFSKAASVLAGRPLLSPRRHFGQRAAAAG
jgi:hypothetical protein